MKITELVYCKGKDDFLKQIENCDWAAAKFLTELIKEEKFEQTLGGWAKLYLLIENEKLVSFITLSAQDCVVAPDLSPALWLGFFFTLPEYRGRRYGKRLIDYACDVARNESYGKVYLATDHIGLYEKYGFNYLENRIDVYGEDSRIYFKTI